MYFFYSILPAFLAFAGAVTADGNCGPNAKEYSCDRVVQEQPHWTKNHLKGYRCTSTL